MYTRLLFIVAFLFVSTCDVWARQTPFASGQIPLTTKDIDAFSKQHIYNKTMGKPSLKAAQNAMFDKKEYIARRGIKSIAGKALEGRTMIKVNNVLARQGSSNRLVATSMVPRMSGNPADLVLIDKSGRILEKFQSKLGGDAAVRSVRNPKYAGTKIITPPDQLKWIQNELAKKVANANRRGVPLHPKWGDVQNALKSGQLTDNVGGVRLSTTKQATIIGRKVVGRQLKSLAAQALKETPKIAGQSAGTAARAAQLGTVIRIAGGVTGIVFGVVDIGYGVYELREIDRRYYAGELDNDIAMGKRILAGGRMILGGVAVAAGVLILVPEPLITKAIALGLTITIIAGHAVLMVADYFLERTQAKRVEHRRELLAKISWDERRKVCLDQLREMAKSPTLGECSKQVVILSCSCFV